MQHGIVPERSIIASTRSGLIVSTGVARIACTGPQHRKFAVQKNEKYGVNRRDNTVLMTLA
jgi:hypothetical protein